MKQCELMMKHLLRIWSIKNSDNEYEQNQRTSLRGTDRVSLGVKLN